MKNAPNSFTVQTLLSLKQRVEHALYAFKEGEMLLIADDEDRENEVDLVFHAAHANTEKVNFAIQQARGLLCVSIEHTLADKLGFFSSPKNYNENNHTNFTLTVDARYHIKSGISASDRATTIQLMANPIATHLDFITPGHVFPIRSQNGGLLARSGHTESVYELCELVNMPKVAAMCEIIDDHGAAICPKNIRTHSIFKDLSFISTVDLLWYKVFFAQKSNYIFSLSTTYASSILAHEKSLKYYNLEAQLEKNILLNTSIVLYDKDFNIKNLRIVYTNGFYTQDNLISQKEACAEIIFLTNENFLEQSPSRIEDFCKLSSKDGVQKTHIGIKKLLSLFYAIKELFKLKNMSFKNCLNIQYPVCFQDIEILNFILNINNQ